MTEARDELGAALACLRLALKLGLSPDHAREAVEDEIMYFEEPGEGEE